MTMQTAESQAHPLVKIINDRFSRYSSDRQIYEQDWRTDWDAWQRIYTSKWKPGEGQDWRSEVFIGITDLKVRIATAAITETLFQGGMFPFDLSPTPEAEVYGMVGLGPEELEERTRLMKLYMQDQFITMKAERELKNAVLELVVMGSMVTKCPILVPTRRRRWAPTILGSDPLTQQPVIGHQKFIMERELLAFKHISTWDFFLDAEATGPQRWQGAEGCVHRGRMSCGEFRRFSQQSAGFLRREVARVIDSAPNEGTIGEEGEEGPQREKLSGRSKKPIVIKEYWGVLTKKEMGEGGSQMRIISKEWTNEEKKDLEEFEICCVVANDVLVKVSRNFNDGIRPFQYCRYNIVPHQGPGWGIPKNMRDSQAMLNGTVRGYLDNLAITATATGTYDPEAFLPGVSNTLQPGLFMGVQPGRDLKKALNPILIPNVAQYLLPAVDMFEKYASEQSVPNLLGGRTDEGQPDTAYGQARMWEGAFKMLLDPTRNIDDEAVKPIVEEFYHFNMSDPEVPDNAKADLDVIPTGMRTFTDKNIRGARLRDLLKLGAESEAVNLVLKVHPLVEDIVKTMDENPTKYMHSLDEVGRIKMLEDTVMQLQGALEELIANQPPEAPGGAPG